MLKTHFGETSKADIWLGLLNMYMIQLVARLNTHLGLHCGNVMFELHGKMS